MFQEVPVGLRVLCESGAFLACDIAKAPRQVCWHGQIAIKRLRHRNETRDNNSPLTQRDDKAFKFVRDVELDDLQPVVCGSLGSSA